MNKVLPLLAFSLILLVPVGTQEVFAGGSICGNGIVETGETCDDANANYCDGCTPLCTLLDSTCDDANICTNDTCQPSTGCVNTPNVSPCNDGNACTTPDVCSGGVCVGDSSLQCDDVGGELIPIDKTALLLAGAQSFSWMLPVVLSVLGIGLFVVSRKSENS